MLHAILKLRKGNTGCRDWRDLMKKTEIMGIVLCVMLSLSGCAAGAGSGAERESASAGETLAQAETGAHETDAEGMNDRPSAARENQAVSGTIPEEPADTKADSQTEGTSQEEPAAVMAQPDILLTDAPPLKLQDSLSSRYEQFEVKSGNYSWNYPADNGEMTGVIACGSGPLDAAADAEKLVVPEYNGLDAVPYSVFLTRTPDQIRVVEYAAADAGSEDAEPLSETLCESPYYIELKKNRIYDITALWAEEKLEENGFYGEAEYFIVTE